MPSPTSRPQGDRDLDRWRRDFEYQLLDEEGELSLAALFWLPEGLSVLGSGPGADFRLDPALRAPDRIGTFTFGGEALLFTPAPGCPVVWGHEVLGGTCRLPLPGPVPGTPLVVGPLRISPVLRWGLAALEVHSPLAPARLDFGGLRWYPFNPGARVRAWVEGTSLRFSWEGQTLTWPARWRRDGGGWVVFQDPTNGCETAPRGRQLAFGTPDEGQVLLDFNRAVTLGGTRTAYGEAPDVIQRSPLPIRAGELWPPSALSAGWGI